MKDPLPTLRTTLSADQVRTTLDTTARRGKLAGYENGPDPILFSVSDFGQPFEGILEATLHQNSGGVGGGGGQNEIRFTARIKSTVPIIFTVILVLSIWPGVVILDSMLRKYFSWYTIPTWWWYFPLSIPTTPWAIWSTWRKSAASARAEAEQIIQQIAAILGAGNPDPARRD